MRFEIAFERLYPHPPESVWRALTDQEGLARWLMETDFVAGEGESFKMWCENPDGETDHYQCRVVALEPMRRMVWSWKRVGSPADHTMRVEFRVAAEAGGTLLTIRHTGDEAPPIIDAFRGGWPEKLDRLSGATEAPGT